MRHALTGPHGFHGAAAGSDGRDQIAATAANTMSPWIRFAVLVVLMLSASVRAQTAPADVTLKRQFTWPTTRPIGIWHVSDPTRVTPENPAGWLDGKDWVDKYLERALPVTKEIGAQGIIVWDIEGSAYTKLEPNVGYLGAPDQAPLINPSVNYARFFKRARDEGLLVGVCIRPTEFNPRDLKQEESPDPYQTLLRKVAFARTVWKCKLIYIDTNMRNRPSVANAWSYGDLLPASTFARLHKAFDDVLFIPEHENEDYFLWTAPYQELRGGDCGPIPAIRRAIPNAISVINCSGGNIKLARDELRKSGCILMLDCWWRNPQVDEFKGIYSN